MAQAKARAKGRPQADGKSEGSGGRGRCGWGNMNIVATVALQNGHSTSMAMELCDYRELQSIKVEEE